MRDILTRFGDNAGRIWSSLNSQGCLDKDEIIRTTKLNEEDFFSGVGWLARENKISRVQDDCFKLDQTNLEPEIGFNAGKIYKILDIWGEADFITIKRLSDLEENQIHAALGWLAREEKIYLNENKKLNLKS